MWSERHRPIVISDMVGNEESRNTVIEWFTKWRPGKRPLLLVGPPGTGKTTLAYLAAKRFGYDMVSLNASDVRSKARITEVLSPVLGNSSVMGNHPMIFVDEVDGIHGRSDYGGASALTGMLKTPSVPIILAANDESSSRIKGIITNVQVIPFKRVPPRLLRAFLEGVLKIEYEKTANLSTKETKPNRLGPGSLIKIINRSQGDIRAMMNLAQSLVTGFDPPADMPIGVMSPKSAVNAFFTAETIQDARSILRKMRVDPREKIYAFYSSVTGSNPGDPHIVARCLEAISAADMLYGRIMRTQNWRLLRYLDDILLRVYQGKTSRIKYSQYNISWNQINRIRYRRPKIKEMAVALAPMLHVSHSTFVTLYMPYIIRQYSTTKESGTVENNTKGSRVSKWDIAIQDNMETIKKEASVTT